MKLSKPMKCGVPEQVVPGQAEVEAADGRVQVEHQEADRGRQDEEHRHAQIAPAGRLVATSYTGLEVSCNDGSTVSVVMRVLLHH